MTNSLLVKHGLDKVYRDLGDAMDHLGRTYATGGDTDRAPEDLRLALEATVRAISSVAVCVAWMAELPDYTHPDTKVSFP